MHSITTHLWFDRQAVEAAEWYVSLMPGSRMNSSSTLRNTPSGDTEVVSFDLAGRPFMAISAGPPFKFNPSISLQVRCRTRDEVDAMWRALSDGGKVMMPLDHYPFNPRFGWIADKYGLSWQVMLAQPRAEPGVTTALMFTGPGAGCAEEAMNLYTSVFRSPPPMILSRYGADEAPDREGTVRIASFTLANEPFAAMDSAHAHGFTFNEAISFVVPCDTQDEIDYYWERLAADPAAGQCGWIKDRFGVFWQITPAVLGRMLSSADQAQVARVTQAFLKMKKFDIATLQRAYGQA